MLEPIGVNELLVIDGEMIPLVPLVFCKSRETASSSRVCAVCDMEKYSVATNDLRSPSMETNSAPATSIIAPEATIISTRVNPAALDLFPTLIVSHAVASLQIPAAIGLISFSPPLT